MLLLTTHANTQALDLLSNYKRVFIKTSGPENYVNCLLNDARGFLWLGTNNGLYRFDGKENDEIRLSESRNNNLRINDLALYKNTLLVATNEGLLQFDLNSYQLLKNSLFSNSKEEVLKLLVDPNDGIWWYEKNGQLRHWKNSVLKTLSLNIGDWHRSNAMFFYKGDLWLTTQLNGTYLIDGEKMKIHSQVLLPSIKTNEWTVKKTAEDELFVASSIGLFKLMPTQNGFETRQLSDGYFSEIITQNNMKFSVVKGNLLIYHYDSSQPNKNITLKIGADKPEIINQLTNNKDRLFIATTNGFTLLDFKRSLIQNLHSTYNPQINMFEVPRGILETEQHYFLSTYSGIYQYQKKNLSLPPVFKKIRVTYALLKKDHTIWMATDGEGIKKWDLLTNKIDTVLNIPKEIRNFRSIALLDENTLLLGGYDQLLRYDLKTGVSQKINLQHQDWGIKNNQLYNISVQKDKRFYLATAFGVLLADEQGKIFADYGKSLTQTADKQAYALWVSNDRSVWVGTGNGLYHFAASGKILHHYNSKNGLTGDRVASITPDKNNHLWIATFTGLSYLDLNNFEIKNFTKEDGLPDNEFNHGSSLLTANGEVILGTVNGFVKLNPADVVHYTRANTSLNISKIEVGNSKEEKTLMAFSGAETDRIAVDKQFNYARIKLSLDPLDFQQKTVYEYKVQGIHSEWIKMGNNPVVYLDNYKKGLYQLEIRAITGQGTKDILTKNITLEVDEYFHKTIWFYIALLGLFFILILMYLLIYIKRNQKIVAIRQHIAQDLHDEIGSYLTGINMNIELMQQKKGMETEQIETIQSLGKKALTSLRDSLWSLDIKSDNGLQFWDRVKTMAAETYGPLDIPFSINGIPEMEKINLTMLEKNYLLYAIKECITNSLKYGNKKQVALKWELKNGLHQITISNSINEAAVPNKNGQGTYNISSRMKKIRGDVKFFPSNEIYTVVLQLNFIK